jgi:hypothetical protein
MTTTTTHPSTPDPIQAAVNELESLLNRRGCITENSDMLVIATAMRELVARVTEERDVEAKLAAARRDAERLDWLERFLQDTTCSVQSRLPYRPLRDDDWDANHELWSNPYSIGREVETEHRGCYSWEEFAGGEDHRRLRAAIDAAMKEDGK